MKTLEEMTPIEVATVLAGAWAAMDKLPATACPYGPQKEDRMNAWLQGFVTESDDPGRIYQLIFGRQIEGMPTTNPAPKPTNHQGMKQ